MFPTSAHTWNWPGFHFRKLQITFRHVWTGFLLVCLFCNVTSGVSVMKGQEEVHVHAPVIVSNAGIFNTYQKLLPKELQAKPGEEPLVIWLTTVSLWVEASAKWLNINLQYRGERFFFYVQAAWILNEHKGKRSRKLSHLRGCSCR